MPKHVAIIMDGNGRWAKQRGLPRSLGHKKGTQRVREVLQEAQKLGIKIVTIFAFSSENWARPPKEVQILFSYMQVFLAKYKQELVEQGVKLNMIGRRDRIDRAAVRKIEEAEALTRDNKSFVLNVALDYGGRWDIVTAAKQAMRDVCVGKISEDKLDEGSFSKYLCLGDMPDPDLMIRTSGEQRISNFLLWDLAYSEFYFSDKYWPDFDKAELRQAIEVYRARRRRFGRA